MIVLTFETSTIVHMPTHTNTQTTDTHRHVYMHIKAERKDFGLINLNDVSKQTAAHKIQSTK